MVERKRITCPETARPAEIDLERTPMGVVIAGCSHFVPRCNVACTRDCAKRIDNRERDDADDRAERVLVAYAGDAGRTSLIARTLADQLSRDGFTVELADVELSAPPPPQDYDAVVVGARAGFGPCAHSILSYLLVHREALGAIPSFFFSVGESSLLHGLVSSERHVEHLTASTGWRPTAWTMFGSTCEPQSPKVHEFALRIADLVPMLAPGVEPQ